MILSTHPTASLLGLPQELRLQILGYLLPDLAEIPTREYYQRRQIRQRATPVPGMIGVQVWTSISDEDYVSLRKDGDSCWPTVLCVNQQIYNEGMDILYLNKAFAIEVTALEWIFGNKTYTYQNMNVAFTIQALDEQLKHIRAIRIRVGKNAANAVFNSERDDVPKGMRARDLKTMLNIFATCCWHAPALRSMDIEFNAGQTSYAIRGEHKPETIQWLQWLFGVFDILRGFEHFKVHLVPELLSNGT